MKKLKSRDRLLKRDTQVDEQQQQQQQQQELDQKENESKLLIEIEGLRRELNETQVQLQEQAEKNERVLADAQKDFDKRLERAKLLSQQQRKQMEASMQNRIQALQREVLDMDQSLESTQTDLQKVQRKLAERQEEYRTLERDQKREKEKLQKEQRIELDAVQEELLSAQEAARATEIRRTESVEIANAAVQAAERRERELARELAETQEQLAISDERTAVLERKLSVLQAAMMKQDASGPVNGSNTAGNDLLEQIAAYEDKIESLTRALEEEKSANKSRRKTDRPLFQEPPQPQQQPVMSKVEMKEVPNGSIGPDEPKEPLSSRPAMNSEREDPVATAMRTEEPKRHILRRMWRRVRRRRTTV